MKHDTLIQLLNQQLNREVKTFLRYILQAASIKGAAHEPIRQIYLAEVTDEVGHAQFLANQIRMLGGTPELKPDLTAHPEGVTAMLTADVVQEGIDVANYVKLAAQAEAADFYSLKMKLEAQAAGEDEYAHEMRRLLG
jgi:bacterioferritin